MRGRPGCPTERKKNSVGATGGSPPFFISTRKGWVLDRPLIRPGFAGPPSPRGEGFGGGSFPFRLQHPPPPARPAGGRAVTGVGYRAAGQSKKEGGPPQGPPNQKRWVQGGRNSSSLVFFPPAFFQRKPGSPAGVGGGTHVAGPTLRQSRRPPNGAGQETTPQVWTCAGPDHPRRQASPGAHRLPGALGRLGRGFLPPFGAEELGGLAHHQGGQGRARTIPHCSRARGTTEKAPWRGGASSTAAWRGRPGQKGLVHGLVGQNPSRNRGVVSLRTSKAWKSWLKVRVAKAMVLATAKVPVRWNPRP